MKQDSKKYLKIVNEKLENHIEYLEDQLTQQKIMNLQLRRIIQTAIRGGIIDD